VIFSYFQAHTNGVPDIGFLWQINIFGGPALTREEFRSFVPQTFSSFHLYAGTPLGSAGMGLRIWRGADLAPNYELVVAKPSGEPDSQTARLTIRQLW
jgi:hypothetical protein